MSCMKKIYLFVIALLTPLLLVGSVYAQVNNEIQQRDRDQVEPNQPEAASEYRNTEGVNADSNDAYMIDVINTEVVEDGSEEGTDSRFFQKSMQSMNNLRNMLRISNPDEGNQIQSMIENQERIKNTVEANLSEIEERPAVTKFFFGPDYRSAKEIDIQVEALKTQLMQMTQLRERLQENLDREDLVAVDSAKSDLEESIAMLQQELEEKLKGFSLFGWLNKILIGY